jgi:uncharacterized metal-binding protein
LCLSYQHLNSNSFQRWTFPYLWIPKLSLCLSYRCLTATASNGGRSTSSGFPNCLVPQLPASNSNSFQRWTFPYLWIPKLSLCPSYRRLTATASKD